MKRATALLFTAVFVLSLWSGAGVCLAQGDFGEAAAGEIMPGGAGSVMPGIPADLEDVYKRQPLYNMEGGAV